MHKIHYAILPANPAAHIYKVSCRIQRSDPQGQVISLPAWIPGSYLIRDFAKHIISIRALCDGRVIALQKLDKDSWQCAVVKGSLLIEYEVYAWDASVRTAQLDTTQGFFNGSSVFLRVHGQEGEACSVDIQPPLPSLIESEWRVATSMPRLSAVPHHFGEYQVADYQELIDHPVQMGNFELVSFTACGVLHELAVTGSHVGDLQRVAKDLQTLCEYQIRFFGEPAPMSYYLFLLRVVGEGYGGLEHRASCALIASRNSLPQAQQTSQNKMPEAYREFLGLCSHEYFHTWNVKRIKPAAFTPYDLQKPNYTELLWAFEGITSYYDDLILVRSGVINSESYLELVAKMITRVLRGKGRLRQSVADSSYYAWTKFYQQDENSPNIIVSYYAKGALIALCLDARIRQETHNRASLDNVMAMLWQRYGQTGDGVPEDAVEAIASEVAGCDLSEFFNKAVRSTEELPLEETLRYWSVGMQLRAAESPRDNGGVRFVLKPNKETQPNENTTQETKFIRGDFGASVKAENGLPKLHVVVAGGAAQQAGLATGDVIIALDELQTTMANFEAMLGQYAAGQVMQVHAFRLDQLMTFQVELQTPENNTCYLQLEAGSAAESIENRHAWLKAKI